MLSFVPTAAPRPVSVRLPVPGIEETAVFVQVGEREVGIALERVEHAVAVVRVDVDVRDAADARRSFAPLRSRRRNR